MTYEKKENSGTLGKNEERTSETHAEYKGNCSITCPGCKKEFGWWINAWVRTNRTKGNKFFSLSFKFKPPLGNAVKTFGPPVDRMENCQPPVPKEFDPDIPF